VDNDRLRYSYFVSYKHTQKWSQLYSGDSSSVSLLLPAGDDRDHLRNEVTIVISNNAYYNTTFSVYPVTVRCRK